MVAMFLRSRRTLARGQDLRNGHPTPPITGSPTHPVHSPKVDLVLFSQNAFVLACQVGHIEVLLGRSCSEPPFPQPGRGPSCPGERNTRGARTPDGWVLGCLIAAGQSAHKGWQLSQFSGICPAPAELFPTLGYTGA